MSVSSRKSLDMDIFCVYNYTMGKRGRPPKQPDNKRAERVDLRVSAAEKTAFKMAAENSELDLSVWIRVQLHRAAEEQLDITLQDEAVLDEINNG